MTVWVAVVFFAETGWFAATFDSQPVCQYWLESNATALHGAVRASPCRPITVGRPLPRATR
jgi:hypothetical protein